MAGWHRLSQEQKADHDGYYCLGTETCPKNSVPVIWGTSVFAEKQDLNVDPSLFAPAAGTLH